VDSEVPSTVTGIITELLYSVNSVVPVGAVLAKIETGVNTSVTTQPVGAQATTIPAQPAHSPATIQQKPVVEEHIPFVPQQSSYNKPGGNNRFFSPLVLNIANSEGLNLSELERIPGTGADGRVSKKDVLQYITDKKTGKVPAFVSQPQPIIQSVPIPQPEHVYIPQPVTHVPQQSEIQPQTVYIPPPAEIQAESYNTGQSFTPVQIETQQPEYIPPTPVSQPEPIYVPQAVQAQQPFVSETQPANITTQQLHEEIPGISPVEQASTLFEQSPLSEKQKPSVEIIEMDRMRKLISKHMVDSKHISAHVTSFAEADVTNMVIWRDKIKHDFEKVQETKITFTPMFIECLVRVMKRYPIINSSVEGEKILIKNFFNIGMATALPNKNLIVPVIKNAENMSLVGLTKSVNTLANNARNNKLKPEDIQGGTFTFTNVGTFGSLMGTPIINQPQVAILAVGAIKKRPVVIETDKGDFIGIRHMMYLSLSYDHRIIDGSVGASFLTEVAKEFENWDVNRELKLVIKEQYVD
jgi:2-oxoglutarate dehydrogenase E2 component (dihydrolipoamide succinyltransferase)